ncbi:energy transducer TonB family protein [Methylobacterium komagatae]
MRFTVMRSGSVSAAGLARSSGVGQIDSAALSAVRGSLPAAPAGVTQQSLSITIPLNYRVR